ncbi:MAG: hypothetical protein U0797_06505 [Gemmataceae bacterium]
MEYHDHIQGLADAGLAEEVRDFRGLGAVMAWMTRRGIPLSAAEIVQQDEFSLDFLVPLPDGRTVAFGIT